MNLPGWLRDALHRRYCCECSAWEDLALVGREDDEGRESMFTEKPVETRTATVQPAWMNTATAEYTTLWMEPPP